MSFPALDMAAELLARGYFSVPVPSGQKKPVLPKWQELRLDATGIARHFSNGNNIGVLLGEPSNGLVELDQDCAEAVRLAKHFFPMTKMRWGHENRPDTHWGYRATGAIPGVTRLEFRKEVFVELRGTGGQTIFPPSTHPDGDTYILNGSIDPTEVDGDELLRRLHRLGAACLLNRHWPAKAADGHGCRHDVANALAGMLCRGGWDDDDVVRFVEVIAEAAGDEEWRDRGGAARATTKRIKAEGKATGTPKLADLLGRDVVDRVREWLGLGVQLELAPEPRRAEVVPTTVPFETTVDALANYIATIRRYQYVPDVHGIYFVLGVYAANHLPGDPVWGLAVGAAGSGKTESIMPLTAMPDVFAASTMTEASLLSGTSKRDKAKTATGGLLRTIGDFGIILCKDFGSVLSMNRDSRASLLGAFREIFDGSWVRFVGTDGGRELRWSGRVGFVGGCTTDIDTHHSVMASMGERFVLYRLPEATRKELSRVAVKNSRQSHAMRGEIADALVALFASVDFSTPPAERTDAEVERLVCLADFVSMARSPVERDGYKREIELIPDPEAPTRIAKVLARLLDGLRAVGVDDDTAWKIVTKVSRDCVPVLRIKILDLMVDEESRTTTRITNVVGYPRTTIARCCEDLNAHRFLSRDTTGDSNTVSWMITIEGKARYSDAFAIQAAQPEKSEEVHNSRAETPPLKRLRTWTDFSGQTVPPSELTDLDRFVIEETDRESREKG